MRRLLLVLVATVVVGAAAVLLWWRRERALEPRKAAAQALLRLDEALRGGDSQALLDALVPPAAVVGRTVSEQTEFLRKALRDEVSPEGVDALRRGGTYGPALAVFPDAAPRWAGQAGVSASNCVAFRMERNGIVAEVMLATNVTPFKVVRCNNVKQMAGR